MPEPAVTGPAPAPLPISSPGAVARTRQVDGELRSLGYDHRLGQLHPWPRSTLDRRLLASGADAADRPGRDGDLRQPHRAAQAPECQSLSAARHLAPAGAGQQRVAVRAEAEPQVPGLRVE